MFVSLGIGDGYTEQCSDADYSRTGAPPRRGRQEPPTGCPLTVRYLTFPECPADAPAALDDDVLPPGWGGPAGSLLKAGTRRAT